MYRKLRQRYHKNGQITLLPYSKKYLIFLEISLAQLYIFVDGRYRLKKSVMSSETSEQNQSYEIAANNVRHTGVKLLLSLKLII